MAGKWVFDVVTDESNKVVATLIHPLFPWPHPNCLKAHETQLNKEELLLDLSRTYDSYDGAMAGITKLRDRFHPSLD